MYMQSHVITIKSSEILSIPSILIFSEIDKLKFMRYNETIGGVVFLRHGTGRDQSGV